MSQPLKIALVATDDRDEDRHYDEPRPRFGTPVQALLAGLAGREDCEVHVLSCTHRPLAAPARLAGNIHYHSLLVPPWGWLRTGYLGCVRAVRARVRELQPCLVHGQGTERYCALAAVRSGRPSVVTLHGNMRSVARTLGPRPFSHLWLAARLEAWTLPRCGGVLCNSQYTEGHVRPLACRCWRVPNPLRLEFLAPPQASPLAGPARILTVGKVVAYKRQLAVLEVARRLHEAGSLFEWAFVGECDEGPYGREFRRRMAEAKARGYARHEGAKSCEELVRLMDQASALVHWPEEESFGLVVAEALARNLKLFGSRCGGVLDVAAGSDGAELFEQGDWQGLQQAMARWLAAGAPRPSGSADLMRARYHPSVVAGRHLEIYREIVGGA